MLSVRLLPRCGLANKTSISISYKTGKFGVLFGQRIGSLPGLNNENRLMVNKALISESFKTSEAQAYWFISNSKN